MKINDRQNAGFPDSETLLERITKWMPKLRPSERKVGAVVLNDPTGTMSFNMAGLAFAAGVSEPTVMRFCSALGYKGFQDFKIQLAQTIALGLPVTYSAIEPSDSSSEIVEKVFNHTISSLDRARRNLDQASIDSAIQILLHADEMLLVGFGASGIIAQDAQQKFPLFGIPCQAPADYHQQFIAAAMSGPRSVTFAISNTGHTYETLRVAAAAREAGATVISMTEQRSPLSDLADVALYIRTFEDTDFYTPSVSRLAGLVVIDILATSVALLRSPEHLARVAHMKSHLAAMRHEAHGDNQVQHSTDAEAERRE